MASVRRISSQHGASGSIDSRLVGILHGSFTDSGVHKRRAIADSGGDHSQSLSSHSPRQPFAAPFQFGYARARSSGSTSAATCAEAATKTLGILSCPLNRNGLPRQSPIHPPASWTTMPGDHTS